MMIDEGVWGIAPNYSTDTFADLKKQFNCALSGVASWLWVIGFIFLITGNKIGLFSTRAALCLRFCSLLLWTEFLGVAKWHRVSCSLVLTCLCWLHSAMGYSSQWGCLQHITNWHGLAPPSLMPWFPPGKGWIFHSRLVTSACLKQRRANISKICAWVREEWSGRLRNKHSIYSNVNAV